MKSMKSIPPCLAVHHLAVSWIVPYGPKRFPHDGVYESGDWIYPTNLFWDRFGCVLLSTPIILPVSVSKMDWYLTGNTIFVNKNSSGGCCRCAYVADVDVLMVWTCCRCGHVALLQMQGSAMVLLIPTWFGYGCIQFGISPLIESQWWGDRQQASLRRTSVDSGSSFSQSHIFLISSHQAPNKVRILRNK